MGTVGENLRRLRLERGLSQDQLAEAAKTTQSTIDRIERDEARNSRFLPRIAGVLRVSLADLDPSYADAPETRPRAFIPQNQLMQPGRDFPIYTAVEGGPGELIRSSEPVDWVPRPEPVARVAGAYGLYVVGESMLPEFEPGNIALVNPILPQVGNTTCVLYAELHGEARATIKRVLRAGAKDWHLRQWNPKKDFTLPRKEWGICHRVIGKYYQQ